MSSAPKRTLSREQYLEIERAADTRSEFFRGEMFAMTGASRRHNLINGNIFRHMHTQFDDRPCEVYQSDMRVKINSSGLYTYPDIVAICGEPQFEDAAVDTLLNPQVIFEVLSKSTETYDRGVKFEHYQQLKSLQEYVLVSQTQPWVERYLRQPNNTWVYQSCNDLEVQIEIHNVNCLLKMKQIYTRVEFDENNWREIHEPQAEYAIPDRPSHV